MAPARDAIYSSWRSALNNSRSIIPNVVITDLNVTNNFFQPLTVICHISCLQKSLTTKSKSLLLILYLINLFISFIELIAIKTILPGFPGGLVVKNLPANAEDLGSIPGPGRSHMPQGN